MQASKGFDHSFERALAVSTEELELVLRSKCGIGWSDFYLNPRRLRGSDFLMRWSQGVWSEERLRDAVNYTGRYYAIPYGPSGTAPAQNIRDYELYFERLEKAGLGKLKRPDLLIFRAQDTSYTNDIIQELKGLPELAFVPEEDSLMQKLLSRALIAVECENSLWRARQMPDYNSQLTPQKRLKGRPGLKKTAVTPTVIIKKEDLEPLMRWQKERGIPIHLWHAFFDEAFGISLEKAESLISSGEIEETPQVYQAPGGATTRKIIFKIYYHHAYRLAVTRQEPSLIAESITDKNGHILPFVRFEGGCSELCEPALQVLDMAGRQK